MAKERATYGTRLCRAFHKVRVEGDCWLQDTSPADNRQVLVWNLWHGSHFTYKAVCENKRNCINPRHAKRNNPIYRIGWPYDHPQILNRWALLQWYAAGNTDYQLVSIEDAFHILQQEVA